MKTQLPLFCGMKTGLTRSVYSCAGAAGVGEIADRTARRLAADGLANLGCLASISGRVTSRTALAATHPFLVIDGCPQECAAKSLELAGLSHLHRVRVTDLGFDKDTTTPTDAIIHQVAAHCRPLFGH